MELNDTNFEIETAKITQGILLFYKKTCPHCLNMRRVIEKFKAKTSGVIDIFVDCEDNPIAMKMMEVEQVPTLLIIKNGISVASKTGLMNPRELDDMYHKCHP